MDVSRLALTVPEQQGPKSLFVLPRGPKPENLPTEKGHFGRMSATSPAMRQVFGALDRLAPLDLALTLVGESGTGKDLLARLVHEHGPRAAGPFVVFDCGAISEEFVESELLGHERGAFPSAIQAHVGAFERAHGGTLFLEQVGELPLELQTKLLRVLENRTVRRVGSRQERPFDVRVIAATNRDLLAEGRAGRFRQDLFFRIAAALVEVPPLRDRLDDIPELVSALLADLGHPDVRVSDAAYQLLRRHAWPGNVRELKNTLACALAFAEAGRIEAEHLRLMTQNADASELERLPLAGQRLDRIERAAIKLTLSQSGGNKVQAARVLGIAVSTLYEKLKKYELT